MSVQRGPAPIPHVVTPLLNVMTGNSTQLVIAAAALIYARFRPGRVANDPGLAAQVAGFLTGAFSGAAAYAFGGPLSACLAIVAVAGLIAWSAVRGGSDPA